MQIANIPDYMTETERFGPAKHSYTEDEKIRIMEKINEIYANNPSWIEELVRNVLQDRIADARNNPKLKEQAKNRESCLNLLRKEVPIKDFTYLETEEFLEVAKNKGEFAAYLSYYNSRHNVNGNICEMY